MTEYVSMWDHTLRILIFVSGFVIGFGVALVAARVWRDSIPDGE